MSRSPTGCQCALCRTPKTMALPALSRAEIEQIERTHFPHLYEICHTEVKPRPSLLQKLWANCIDY